MSRLVCILQAVSKRAVNATETSFVALCPNMSVRIVAVSLRKGILGICSRIARRYHSSIAARWFQPSCIVLVPVACNSSSSRRRVPRSGRRRASEPGGCGSLCRSVLPSRFLDWRSRASVKAGLITSLTGRGLLSGVNQLSGRHEAENRSAGEFPCDISRNIFHYNENTPNTNWAAKWPIRPLQ
jgi:hypothetical protein